VAIAAAQPRPEPVVRLGEWVEIGNDVFMNVIASNTIYYRTTHNYDFDADVRDVIRTEAVDALGARAEVTSSQLHFGPCDCLWAEARFGADFRYQKNLTARVLLEAQSIFDGNLIDDTNDDPENEENAVHVERFWIKYDVPGTPITLQVGAPLWFHDAAGLLADDDPGIFLSARFGPKQEIELKAAAIIQQESARLGLTNDNDNVYYLFTAAYNMQPHRFALDIWFQRDRFNGPTAGVRQQHDVVWLAPNWTGSFGPISGLLEFVVAAGTAQGTDGVEYDVFTWALVAQLEANLGLIRPVVGLIFGMGDDNPDDTDLQGFSNLTNLDIGLVGFTRHFNLFDGFALNDNGPSLGGPTSAFPVGFHVVYNPLLNRVGNGVHGAAGSLSTPFGNSGTLLIPVGVKIFPVKGHEFGLWYVYVGLPETATIERQVGADVNKSLFHEIGAMWTWTLNRHFDIRARGVIGVPDDGVKDIARAAGLQGDDPALFGEVRFRGRF
jgi:hypothetical protein